VSFLANYNLGLRAVQVFVDELYHAGIRHVCIAPGSRSTPLTIAFARHLGMRVWTVLDERSAGFFAYGMARAKHEPVVLLCTSGTATANFFPAVMEAFQSEVPLFVITADRPPELHGVGSNQTVNQNNMYGTFVKRFISMPVPEDESFLLDHAKWTAVRATSYASGAPSGPVHINWPFREPLLPPPTAHHRGNHNHYSVHVGTLQLSQNELAALASSLSHVERGIIICGPQDDMELVAPLIDLATQLQFPILADPLSQLRTSGIMSSFVIDHYDAFLRAITSLADDHPLRNALQPQVVIRIGHTPTSKVLGQYLSGLTEARQVVISSNESWQDPFFTATEVWQADPVLLIQGLTRIGFRANESKFAALWMQVSQRVREVIRQEVQAIEPVFEGRVWQELARMIPQGSTIFAGNSMPIRDMDSLFPAINRSVRVIANRGASGIDGVISSALGVSAVEQAPVFLVIGDLSFHHDITGLMIAKMHRLPLIVILIQNDGGGIFSFLPQSTQPDVFSYFSTSHGLDFEAIVKSYDGRYQRIADWSQFQTALTAAMEQPGLQVLELRTDRDENVRLHQQLFLECAKVLEDLGVERLARD
jgi:2-succinyl-5-enolpyruvyl-6-hydroxy-3-cyclohexene-1-carboxylate synthase